MTQQLMGEVDIFKEVLIQEYKYQLQLPQYYLLLEQQYGLLNVGLMLLILELFKLYLLKLQMLLGIMEEHI
jgi:hypothetical protein